MSMLKLLQNGPQEKRTNAEQVLNLKLDVVCQIIKKKIGSVNLMKKWMTGDENKGGGRKKWEIKSGSENVNSNWDIWVASEVASVQ